MSKINLHASQLKISKDEGMNLIIAAGYLHTAQMVMPLKIDDELATKEKNIQVGMMFVGCFNYAQGFELVFKSLVKSLGQKPASRHGIIEDYKTILKSVPELGKNIDILIDPNNKQTAQEKAIVCIETLGEEYHSSRYFGQMKKETSLPNTNLCRMLVICLMTTFPYLSQTLSLSKFKL